MANIDLGDYNIGETTAEIESAYAEKMAEYYDYENYELNYADYGYDDSNYDVQGQCNSYLLRITVRFIRYTPV